MRMDGNLCITPTIAGRAQTPRRVKCTKIPLGRILGSEGSREEVVRVNLEFPSSSFVSMRLAVREGEGGGSLEDLR